MSVELYETMFLLDANKVASEGEAIRNALHATLEKHGGEIVISRPWDDRKIAYSIRRAGTTHKLFTAPGIRYPFIELTSSTFTVW